MLTEHARNKIEVLISQEKNNRNTFRIPSLLKAIKKHKVTRAQLATTISIRYEVAHFFAILLNMFHNRICREYPSDGRLCKTDYVSRVIFENWCDEMGFRVGIDPGAYGSSIPLAYLKPHAVWRGYLLDYLGFKYDQWIREHNLPSPLAQNLDLGVELQRVDIHVAARQLLVSGLEVIQATGILPGLIWFTYYEGRIARIDYPILLAGLKHQYKELQKNPFTPEDRYDSPRLSMPNHPAVHLYTHIISDPHHELDLINATAVMIESQKDLVEVEHFWQLARHDWNRFWESLGETVLNYR